MRVDNTNPVFDSWLDSYSASLARLTGAERDGELPQGDDTHSLAGQEQVKEPSSTA